MTKTWLGLSILAGLFFTILAHALADFRAGMDAPRGGDSDTALNELQSLADQGDAIAQFHMGNMYQFGQGVPQGEQEAVRWKPRQDVSESLTKLNAEVVELYRGGKYSEALPLAHRALEMSELALGPEHPDVAVPLTNLASLYTRLGNYAQAEPLYRRSLAIFERALGPEHPDVGLSPQQPGAALCHHGRLRAG